MHCFELRTANVDYYVGEDPNFNAKENGGTAGGAGAGGLVVPPQALETGLGVHLAKAWETAIRQALLPVAPGPSAAAAATPASAAAQSQQARSQSLFLSSLLCFFLQRDRVLYN